ncbi:MAG: ribosome-associated translation inhibitor RaiA [Bacillota bacterium]|nr:ribosome-associated translation inhibitor RaiA [Bacillota bacterium]
MKVIISTKNFNASEHLKDTIEKKFEKLSKYFSRDVEADVTLTMEKGRQKIEATIEAKGLLFRAEETNNDVYAGVDSVVDKLSSQMSRFKTKIQRKHKDWDDISFAAIPDSEEPEPDESPVVRRKSFDLLPMSVDEAIMQMELLEHTFFVFLNMETDSVNVVYKRKQNDYGLLETNY